MSTARKQPTLTVVAGPNGAGKTTFVKALERDGHAFGHYVNPDEIAATMTGDQRGRELRAGRAAIGQARKHIAAGESFTQETTLTGAWAKTLMSEAQAAGFTVTMIYVGIGDLVVSQARVENRVASGGHAVPPADQRRRFDRSLDNLAPAARIADSAVVFDNSSAARPYELVAEIERGQVRPAVQEMPAWASRALAGLPRAERSQSKTAGGDLAAAASKAAGALQDPALRTRAQNIAGEIGKKIDGPGPGRPRGSRGPGRGGSDRDR